MLKNLIKVNNETIKASFEEIDIDYIKEISKYFKE